MADDWQRRQDDQRREAARQQEARLASQRQDARLASQRQEQLRLAQQREQARVRSVQEDRKRDDARYQEQLEAERDTRQRTQAGTARVGGTSAQAAARRDELLRRIEAARGSGNGAASGAESPVHTSDAFGPRPEPLVYPTPPTIVEVGFDSSGLQFAHPEISDIHIGVTQTGFQTFCLVLEWESRHQRSFVDSGTVPAEWSFARADGQTFPLQWRRTGPRRVEMRWMDPRPSKSRCKQPGATAKRQGSSSPSPLKQVGMLAAGGAVLAFARWYERRQSTPARKAPDAPSATSANVSPSEDTAEN